MNQPAPPCSCRPWPQAQLGLLLLLLVQSGCHSVPLAEQQRVSKPGMQFGESPVFQYEPTIISQLQPGLAFSGGAQPTTCSACK